MYLKLKRVDLSSSHKEKKVVAMSGNMLTTIKGEYFPVYTNSGSLHYTSETNINVSYTSKKMGRNYISDSKTHFLIK